MALLSAMWPMAIVKDNKDAEPRIQHTYDDVMSEEKAEDVFRCWNEDYNYILLATWIEQFTDSGERNIKCMKTYPDTWKYLKQIDFDATKNGKVVFTVREETENVHTESH